MKKQSFVYGAIILSLSGIICKMLGAIYKIPLVNVLSAKGIGVYYLVFPVYAFLLTFVSNSFIVSTSKMVSKRVAQGDDRGAFIFFVSTLLTLSTIGLILAVGLCFLSKIIAGLQGMADAYICYLALAPALVAVAISSAFRGYFQGLQNMTPSAISSIIDQLFKLAIGLTLAKIFINKGVLYGAFGAILGVSVAEISSCLFFVFYYLYFRAKNGEYFASFTLKKRNKTKKNEPFKTSILKNKSIQKKSIKPQSFFSCGTKFVKNGAKITDCGTKLSKKRRFSFLEIKEVFKNALPFILSSVILPTSMVIDSFLVVNLLFSMGFDKFFSTGLLGLNSGVVGTLVSLPSTFSVSICMTLVPYLVYSLSQKDYEGVSKKAELTLKLNLIVALPCVIVFLLFSKNVLQLLYAGSFLCDAELNLASTLLVLSSSSVLYLTILQMSTALLQAVGKAYVPVLSLLVSLVVKVACEVLLIKFFGIIGVAISNCICYFLSSFINLWEFRKIVKINLSLYQALVAPLLSCAFMVGAIVGALKICEVFVSFRFASLFAFFVGGTVYLASLVLFRCFTKEEQATFFRKKKKVAKV